VYNFYPDTLRRFVFLVFLVGLTTMGAMPACAFGQIFVTDVTNGTIGEYSFSGTVINSALVTGINNPHTLVVSGNDLFVVVRNTGTIAEYTTTGATVNATLITGFTTPSEITLSGNYLYVSDVGTNTVGKYTIAGAVVNATLVTGLSSPNGVAVCGNILYVVNHGNNTIGEYDATTGAVINAAFISGLNGPVSIVLLGPMLYITNRNNSTIGEYDATTGAAANVPLVSGLALPFDLATDGSTFYVATTTNKEIGAYTIQGITTNASLITGLRDPDGVVVIPAPMAPVVTTQPINTTANVAGNSTFLAGASGSPSPTFQWQISTDGGNTWNNANGAGFAGSTTAQLTIIAATTTQSGNQFRCIATNSVSSATSNAATLTVLPTGQTVVTAIAAGSEHSLFVMSDGSLWAMGDNANGELGDGTTTNQSTAEQIVSAGVSAVAARGTYSVFLDGNGSVWAMGDNGDGELGDGTTTHETMPEETVASGVAAIATGSDHSLILESNGGLWAVGNNSNGQLGNGSTTSATSPVQVVASGVTASAGGEYHTVFLKSDSSLWAMGYNGNGQLGDGTTTNQSSPEQIESSGVIAVAAAANHTLFLESDGSLWGMGTNGSGQLGIGSTIDQHTPEQIVASGVTDIAAGGGILSSGGHTLFLKRDGSLWAMGDNTYGELGDGTTTQRNTPVQIVASGVTAIAGGDGFSLFLKNDGSLWAMGYNAEGQLGDGTTINRSIPEQVYPIIPAITAQPGSAAVVTGYNATFTVAASGSPAPTVQWQLSTDGGSTWNNASGSSYSGTTNTTLTITSPTETQLGSLYRAIITNYVGSVNTTAAPLVVGTSSAQLTWLQNNFTAIQLGNVNIVGATAKPAGDGIPNFIKYAFDLNPNVNGQSFLPQPMVSNGNLALTFTIPPPDVSYLVEASTDLVNWSTTGVNIQINGNQATASYSLSGSTQAFLRIVVSPGP